MSKRLIALLVTGLILFVISPALVQAQDDDQCIVLHPGGAWEYVTCDDPTPTETPLPTSTPTATSTPSPTNTPTAPATSTQAATWEPTAESVTPAPTDIAPSATPQFTGCELRALSTINIRSGHSTDYPVIGSWTTDDTDPREFVEFYDGDRDYLWGRGIDGGWTVIYDKPASAWWAAGTVAAWAKCPAVTGWPAGLETPPEFARAIIDGPHINMGEGGADPVLYANNISACKAVFPAFDMCRYIKAANPDAWIVARLVTDSIAFDNDYDVDAVWNAVQAAIPADFDAFELENEVSPRTDEQWAKWSQFSIDFATRLAAEKGMQYLAFSFGPGNPEFNQYQYIMDYLYWVEDNPLPDGRYHGVSLHASMYAPWWRSDMPWVNEPFIAGRLYLAAMNIKAKYDFDLATWPGVWAVTEIGLSDGYSGNWDAVYTCNELVSARDETLIVYEENGYPQVVIVWNFGDVGGGWTSDHACASVLWG